MSTLREISIMMATYNGERFLREQLDSCLRQKNVKVNILIRDDGSTDRTIAILNEYKTKKLIDWYSGEHKGVQQGYLDLLKNVPKADYYAFCDQDDIWDDDKLQVAISHLDNMPNDKPTLYYCGQRLVDEHLNFISNHKITVKRSLHTNYLISNIAGCTAVFNNKLLDVVNDCSPDFILMHDSWVYKLCLALGGTVYADSEVHISYRQHGNNVTGLTSGLKGKIRQAWRYIDVFKIQAQMQSLLQCYGDKMIPEYRQLTQQICDYNKSIGNCLKLAISKDFDFHNHFLNLIVRLKILIHKL